MDINGHIFDFLNIHDMELILNRFAKKKDYTVGRLYVDNTYFCNTLEDTDRGLMQGQTLEYIKSVKVKGQTAIPLGRYRVTMNVVSPKYSKRAQYDFCDGKVPRLLNVDGFDGILIHIGNTNKDTEGCILVGENTQAGKVTNSTATFKRLYETLKKADGEIWISIK